MDSLCLGIIAIKRRNFQPRSQSGIKHGAETSLQATPKLDYSDTYRENEALDGDLDDYLHNLKRVEKRQLLEKGEELKEIRKQVDVITKLQEAVKTRKPGQSASMVVCRPSRASTQYGRSNTRRSSRPNISTKQVNDNKVPDVDFDALAQATRSQMRIAAERDKYSAKNLFNVRRPKTALGTYNLNDKPTPSHNRLFAGPPLSTKTEQSFFVDSHGEREVSAGTGEIDLPSRPHSSVDGYRNGHSSEKSSPLKAGDHRRNGNDYNSENENNDDASMPQNNHRPQSKKDSSSKRHLRPTTASRSGRTLDHENENNQYTSSNNKPVRPKTAVGFVNRRENEEDDLLPPRAKSAVQRSRSRRELELLCRMLEPGMDLPTLASGDAASQWERLGETRRRSRLQQLQQEQQELNVRVHRFLQDIDGFNKKRSAENTPPGSAGYALKVSSFQGDF